MPTIKGTASVADSRALSKALKSTKFPASFHRKINLQKVNRPVLVQWIETRITATLGFEDEIVQSTAVNLFMPEIPLEEGGSVPVVDPRTAQIDLAGFLGDDAAATFASELWELLLDACENQPSGIPRKLLEQKKAEMAAQKEQQQASATAHKSSPRQQYNHRSDRPRHDNRNRRGGEEQQRPQDRRPVSPAPYDNRTTRGDQRYGREDNDYDRRRRSSDKHRTRSSRRDGDDYHFHRRGDSGRHSSGDATADEYDEYGRRAYRDDHHHRRDSDRRSSHDRRHSSRRRHSRRQSASSSSSSSSSSVTSSSSSSRSRER